MPTDPTNSAAKRDRVQERLRGRWDAVIRDLEREIRGDEFYHPQNDVPIGRQTSAFREWLESELDRQVVEPTITTRQAERGLHWTGAIVREFYEHGITLADEDIREAGGDLPLTFPDAILRADDPRWGNGDGLHHEYLQENYDEIYTDLVDAAHEATKQAYREYRTAARTNQSLDEAVEAVIDRFEKVGKTRTDLVAQAKLVDTINDAILARYEQLGIESVGVEMEVPESAQGESEQLVTDGGVTTHSHDHDHEHHVPDAFLEAGTPIEQHADHDDDVRQVFVTADDDSVCDTCSLYGGHVFTVGEFRSGAVPTPALHPRCRCRLRVFDVTDLGWT